MWGLAHLGRRMYLNIPIYVDILGWHKQRVEICSNEMSHLVKERMATQYFEDIFNTVNTIFKAGQIFIPLNKVLLKK